MNLYNPNADILGDLEDEVSGKTGKHSKMHLRLQQRNGKKSITILEGAHSEFDLKGILRAMKKKFSCGGALKKDDDDKPILTLSGDHRKEVVEFLVNNQHIAEESDFVVHGY